MNTLESLKITSPRDSHFSKKFWNTFIDKLAALVRPYKIYRVLISQSGSDAPTVVILENTLGYIPIWEKHSTGVYKIFDQSGLMNITNTYIPNIGGGIVASSVYSILEAPNIYIYSITYGGQENEYADSLLSSTPFEIKVYN